MQLLILCICIVKGVSGFSFTLHAQKKNLQIQGRVWWAHKSALSMAKKQQVNLACAKKGTKQSKKKSSGLELNQVRKIAKAQNYREIDFKEKSFLVSFARESKKKKTGESVRINVYWKAGTVTTCLDHPKKKKTQLIRKKVDANTLKKIFQDPRLHTGTGYYGNELKKNDNDIVALISELKGELKLLNEEIKSRQRKKARLKRL